ncbi:glycosyltransferase [Paenibacillus sp. J2TS4]|uniref:glycosyltransferase n=1 Tax=Paenibacillus sp. J2TS4 TaxID=2807194 RepID=UPI001B28AD5F|nr:glycosyltransferase [Paenibacillus sp. J2TS4]GIP31281.1 hypothetical protein J2TS4_04910 [Paenibacillus sp. J2TS4]
MKGKVRIGQPSSDVHVGISDKIVKRLRGGRKLLHVLIISVEQLPSFQIGILQPFLLLEKQGVCTFSVINEHGMTEEHLVAADIVIVQRSVKPSVYNFFKKAKKMGKRTVYVIDDYYLAFPPTEDIGKYYAEPSRRKTFIKFLRNADIVKVDASYFGKLLQRNHNSHVVYFPASVDFTWIEQVEKKPKDKSVIVIGYEGNNKERDFTPVTPALLQIIDYYGGLVKLEFYGFVPEALKNYPGVYYEMPEADYRTFIRKLYQCNWDIGLAPLADKIYNNCKTNNKFREYAACGIPAIYSDSPAYKDWVIQGETGMVVPHTTEGWYEGLKQLIDNRSLRSKIKKQAEQEARKHFSIEVCAKQWEEHILLLKRK